MKNRNLRLAALVVLFACVALTAQAQTEYVITVDVDEATASDLELVASYTEGAQDGAAAPKSIRKIANSATGEVATLAESRIDDSGNITLDDGSVAMMIDGDSVKIRPKNPGGMMLSPVQFCMMKPGSNGHRRVCGVCLPGQLKCFKIPRGRISGCGMEVCPLP
jgi:hypothetical protein